jgi:hypothetical protein
VQNGRLVDELRVHSHAVGEGAVQALERGNVPLQAGEIVAHFFVAAGASLAQVPDART